MRAWRLSIGEPAGVLVVTQGLTPAPFGTTGVRPFVSCFGRSGIGRVRPRPSCFASPGVGGSPDVLGERSSRSDHVGCVGCRAEVPTCCSLDVLQNVLWPRDVPALGHNELQGVWFPCEPHRRDLTQVVAVELVWEGRIAVDGDLANIGSNIDPSPG
jgi:hypothetical protein